MKALQSFERLETTLKEGKYQIYIDCNRTPYWLYNTSSGQEIVKSESAVSRPTPNAVENAISVYDFLETNCQEEFILNSIQIALSGLNNNEAFSAEFAEDGMEIYSVDEWKELRCIHICSGALHKYLDGRISDPVVNTAVEVYYKIMWIKLMYVMRQKLMAQNMPLTSLVELSEHLVLIVEEIGCNDKFVNPWIPSGGFRGIEPITRMSIDKDVRTREFGTSNTCLIFHCNQIAKYLGPKDSLVRKKISKDIGVARDLLLCSQLDSMDTDYGTIINSSQGVIFVPYGLGNAEKSLEATAVLSSGIPGVSVEPGNFHKYLYKIHELGVMTNSEFTDMMRK